MMVYDDDLKPSGLGLRQGVIGHGSAIDGNDQAAPAVANTDQCFARRAIALHQAVRDIIACV